MTDRATDTTVVERPAEQQSARRPEAARTPTRKDLRETAHRIGVEAVARALDQAA